MPEQVPAHDQNVTHSYVITYPAHEPRDEDPWARDFREWKRRRKATNSYYCDFAQQFRNGDTSECDNDHPLEAHHKVIEFALKNAVDMALLAPHYPGLTADTIGKWIDSDPNLELLCAFHHRGHGGKHVASVSDFEAQEFIRNLIR